MNLGEIYDSDIPDLWHQQPWGWVGSFSWEDVVYRVDLRETTITDVPAGANYEGLFCIKNDITDTAFSTARPSSDKVPSAVYGVVKNAMRRAYEDFKLDALTFSAERRHAADDDQHQAKVRNYEILARRVWREVGGFLYVHRGTSPKWLLSRAAVGGDYWKNVLVEAQEELDAIGYVTRKVR